MEQLALINEKFNAFSLLDTVVLAVSSDSPEKNRDKATDTFKLTLLSDKNHENARRFASYDDFEDMELHSTILIDREGRVRWKRTGGDPFMKVDYLLAEITRWGQK
jgi:peroxiredoxin